MRFIIALALSLAAAAAAAPQAQAQAQDAGTLTTRQACTVDCACLNEDRTRSWPKTEACCTPSNGGTPDDPVRIPPIFRFFSPGGPSRDLLSSGHVEKVIGETNIDVLH